MRIYEVSSRQTVQRCMYNGFGYIFTTRPMLIIVYFLMTLFFRVNIIRFQIIGTYQTSDQLEYATNIYFNIIPHIKGSQFSAP